MSAITGAGPATASREAPGESPPGRRRPGVALLVIATAQLMVVLDSNAQYVRHSDLRAYRAPRALGARVSRLDGQDRSRDTSSNDTAGPDLATART